MWDYLDVQRTNVTPGLYDERFSWEDYAADVLSTPLMFADLTHTPEAEGASVHGTEFTAFYTTAADLYPDRELNAYEINHVLSTHFNDVRLKNFIEMRHWDSLPIERAELLTQIVSNLFYDVERRTSLESYFSGLTGEDVHAAKAVLQARGGDAKPYDQPMDYWAEVLGVGDALADVPGDAKWPEVRQG